ncbi:hypothetical protein [Methanospirillum sp.]|nr:hypothetical protein [Methanospirillum sp.]
MTEKILQDVIVYYSPAYTIPFFSLPIPFSFGSSLICIAQKPVSR